LLWWEKVDSMLWQDHSDKSNGQTSSRLATSTGMMALATLKNSFRCINFLPTTLTRAAKSWLINLPEGSITSLDQLCATFIRNFQGTYERPSTVETLKTIRKKHDESLQVYVKHFYNAKNAIPYIQDIEIINAFRDGVSVIKIVKEITMKKPKIVAGLPAVADVCIEASEAWARLLESRGKGMSRKRKIKRLTQLTEAIARTKETTDIVASNPRSRKRKTFSASR
jgi:hypothetical protein